MLVTAVITTYKREIDILKRAVDSVLAQTHRPLELIIVDDNRDSESELSDKIAEFVASLTTDIDVRLLKTEAPKHGAQPARNTGIHASRGKYLAFLDDDDEWLPEKVEKQHELMEKSPNAGMCFCEGYRVNENFNPPFVNLFHGNDQRESVTYRELLRGDCIGSTTQAMIRKSAFDKIGEFDERLPARQDYEMWIRIAKDFDVIAVCEPLFRYHISNGQAQITKSFDKCIEGHTLLYEKYKADIDSDARSKFNVLFFLAHYYYFKGDKGKGVQLYIKAFFTSPISFWDKGLVKLRQLKEAKKAKKQGGH